VIEFKKHLTKRHEQMLIHIALGGSSLQFAMKHKLSTKTVESHRYELYRELDIHSRSEATIYAHRYGFIDLPRSIPEIPPLSATSLA